MLQIETYHTAIYTEYLFFKKRKINEEAQVGYDYIDQPVPQNERRSWWEITFITSGFSLAVSGIFSGAALAAEISLGSVILASLLGNFLLTIIRGTMGASTRVATSFLPESDNIFTIHCHGMSNI